MQKIPRAHAAALIIIIALGCTTDIAINHAFASGSPLPFDGFTVDNGEITAACPSSPFPGTTSTTCIDGISSDGMLQRKVIVEGGTYAGTYLQFILTEPGVTGDASAVPFSAGRGNLFFTNEDFVMQNHRADGLTSKQRMFESEFIDADTEERFVNDLVYNHGWAQSGTDRWIQAEQRISTVNYSGIDPLETFYTSADLDIGGSSAFEGSLLLKQGVNLDSADGTGLQKFQYDKKDGFGNPYPCFLPASYDCSVELPNLQTMSWNQFETITALWIGQILDSSGSVADQDFGHTRFENKDSLTEARYTSLTDADAVVYPTDENYTGSSPYQVVYTFDAVDTMSGNNAAWDPIPSAFINGMPQVSATVTPAMPQALQPTMAAGTASADMTVASAPMGYDGWTVSNGVFAVAPCPVGVECAPPIVNSQGLFQRVVTVSGVPYVHTIITEENATGDPSAPDFDPSSLTFKNETFVRIDQFLEGVASRLHIAEQDLDYQSVSPGQGGLDNLLPESGGQFVYNTEVKTGWAHGGPRDPILDVDQTVLVEDSTYLGTSSVYNYFRMRRGETTADTAMDMLNVSGTHSNVAGEIEDPIMHATSVRSGAFNNTSRTLGDAPQLTASGNIAWNSGDAIQVNWIGGNYATSIPTGRSIIGSTSYTNLSTGDHVASTVTDADFGVEGPLYYPDPETWVTPFDDATPTYTDPFLIP